MSYQKIYIPLHSQNGNNGFQTAKTELGEWEPGKRFLVSDNRASLVFDPNSVNPEEAKLGGKTIEYAGVLSYQKIYIPLHSQNGNNGFQTAKTAG